MTAAWSVEAEQSVLGSLMHDAAAMDRAQPLAAGDFFDPRHGDIYAAAQALASSRRPIDPVTLFAQVGAADVGGLGYLNALSQSVPSARNVGRYAEIVREHAHQRALIAAADEAMEIARGDGAVSDKLDRIASTMAVLSGRQVRQAPRRLADIALQRTEHYDALQAGSVVSGWPCHIPSLDRALAGGFRPGKLYFVGARPAVGKSSLSAQILIELARDGRPGLMLSQEMAAEEVADRAVSNVGRIDYGRLQTGKMEEADWSRAVEMLHEMSSLPVWVDDQPALTLGDIRNKARMVPGLKVLVLDYLQLCSKSAGTKAGNRNSEIEEISRGLKALAMEMGLAVIALSQLNREVEKRAGQRPQLADLRDSGSIEQDADAVLFLWPVRDLDEGGRLIGLNVAKNRQGRTCDIALDFRGAVQRWTESTETLQQAADEQPKQRGFRG